MHINIKATGMELTPTIKDYVQEKVGSLGKFLESEGEAVMTDVEVGKTTNHHQSGDIYRAEINISIPGRKFVLREEVVGEDLYAAIDVAKNKAANTLSSVEAKKQTLLRKGGRAIKDLLRGWRRK